jgi:hypothetical protein
MARRRNPRQGTPSPDVSAGLALAQSLEQQRAQWEGLSRAQRDAAYDMVLWTRQQQQGKDAADKLTQSTRATTLAYAAASAGLLGWVRAGLAGTTTGELLSFQQRQLSQQIASIFLPVVQKYIDGLTRLVEWFRHLSGEQQVQIMRWSLFTVGLLGSVTVVPRLTSALGTLAMTLKGLTLANPFAALTAAVIGLMAQTEEGRASLADLGQSLKETFGNVADLLSGPVGKGLAGITHFLSTGGGMFLAFGTIAVSVLYRIAVAGQGAAQAFLGWGTVLGAVSLVLAGLAFAVHNVRDEAKKMGIEIAGSLAAGEITREQAEQQARAAAIKAGVKAESQAAGGGGLTAAAREAGVFPTAAEVRRMVEEDTFKGIMREIIRQAQGRQDVVQTAGGREDPRATIRRLEAAVLKTDDPGKRTAAGVEAVVDILRRWGLKFDLPPGKPNPNEPVKED